eukprot:11375689-Prorocentrum_lima.AAC.1
MEDPESLEQYYKQGHVPKRKDCPACQETSGPAVRHHLTSYRAEKYGTLHVNLTGPFGIQGERGHQYRWLT